MKFFWNKTFSFYYFLVFIFILYFLFLWHRHSFFLYPFYAIIESPPPEVEEIFFPTGINGWYYPPLDPLGQNLVIYLNGNSGNVSTRISQIKIIQNHIIPINYGILHLDYPQYGISMSSSKTTNIDIFILFKEIKKTYPFILQWKQFSQIGFWCEDIGTFLGLLFYNSFVEEQQNNTNQTPDWYLFFNGIFDMRTLYSEILPNFIHIFFLPFLSSSLSRKEKKEKHKSGKKTKFIIAHAKENANFCYDDIIPIFFEWCNEDLEKSKNLVKTKHHTNHITTTSHFIHLEGTQDSCLFLKKNQERLKDLFLSF